MSEKKVDETGRSDIIHVMTNQFVDIVRYDTHTGQVSYQRENSSAEFTCYDYDLISLRGFDHLRKELSRVSIMTETNQSFSAFY